MAITIYGRPGCGYCESAKVLLKTKGMEFEYKTLDKDFTRDELLATFPNAKTFPQIIVDGVKIGGYDNLKAMLEE